jgi:hypothetical protein
MDPHDVLNLPRYGYTLEQLRYNYKIIALQLHPDKRPATMSHEQATEAFQVLTNAYRTLTAELEGQVPDKTHDQLKAAYAEKQPKPKQQESAHAPQPATKFSLDRFNTVFTENRVQDPVRDVGYEAWMRDNAPGAKAAKPQGQLQAYREPAPFVVGHRGMVQFSELGATGVDDYSRGDVGDSRRSVHYTDYRVAHTTSKLLDDEARYVREAEARARRELRSVDALVKHRAVAPAAPTRDEQAQEERRAAEAERAELRRREALRAQDRLYEETHERMSRLLLSR